MNLDVLERRRLRLQAKLDANKTHAERNRKGQFATPTDLAREILRTTVAKLPNDEPIRFLDPAFGTGSFWSALLTTIPDNRVVSAIGYEIDEDYAEPVQTLWSKTKLDYRVGNFAKIKPPTRPDLKCNLLVCNPPYVRSTRISKDKFRMGQQDDKAHFWQTTGSTAGFELGRNAGMYCHFMWLAHKWMAPGGVAAWLIPSEFMATRYGNAVRTYLLQKVTLLDMYRFDAWDTQFEDANITSVVLWLKNAIPASDHPVRFGYGGTLDNPTRSMEVLPKDLRLEENWTRFPLSAIRAKSARVETLQNFFTINHGYNFRHMRHLLLSLDQVKRLGLPREFFRPVLPKPKFIPSDIIESNKRGTPLLARQPFLFMSSMSEDHIKLSHPKLFAYLEMVKQLDGIGNDLDFQGKPWYAQIKIPQRPTRIICTHFGRLDPRKGRPPRFLLNRSAAIITYPYLELHPVSDLQTALEDDPTLIDQVFQLLQTITRDVLLSECHLLGGGLCKVEPFNLYRIKLPELRSIIPTAENAVSKHFERSLNRKAN
jgi:adenine-specific DNA-methyltransferase